MKSKQAATNEDNTGDASDSDASIGPALPGQLVRSSNRKAGPSIPNMEDLALKRGETI